MIPRGAVVLVLRTNSVDGNEAGDRPTKEDRADKQIGKSSGRDVKERDGCPG